MKGAVGSARSMRTVFTAAAARPAGGSGGGVPRRLARPSSLRPLQAAAAVAADQESAAAGEEGVHTLAPTAGVLEPALTWPARSHGCGEVAESDVGAGVTVCGWVDRYRNLGGILFLDIRDHTGIVQVGAAACHPFRPAWTGTRLCAMQHACLLCHVCHVCVRHVLQARDMVPSAGMAAQPPAPTCMHFFSSCLMVGTHHLSLFDGRR